MKNENAYGSRKDSLEYWQNNRNKLEDLYESERYLLEPIFGKVKTVLDIGCAGGGTYQICKEVNQALSYTGIDISPELIRLARKQYPNIHFEQYNGHNIPFSSELFDLVFSIGVLHHLPHWQDMIIQMVSISKDYIVFDLRLTKKKTINPIYAIEI